MIYFKEILIKCPQFFKIKSMWDVKNVEIIFIDSRVIFFFKKSPVYFNMSKVF